ncbi:Rrf2 family transcriptional regulator [Massilia alkalitolerans]|uniref:Rrf2 family transcriptional regulator n=1 Tax=Massilia alkalitolerans TaxID=286638 RepID=UPI0004105683|nr:Rrf2 family transcriptional regulator [Massilia alkalitolerans]
MRLTEFTDHALRLLMYLGSCHGRMATIDEVALEYGISRNHLAKVVNELAADGVIVAVRGRCGGIRLDRDPRELRMGDIVRRTEPNFHMAQCFGGDAGACPFGAACRLRQSLARATEAYLAELNRLSLADLLATAGEAEPITALAVSPFESKEFLS